MEQNPISTDVAAKKMVPSDGVLGLDSGGGGGGLVGGRWTRVEKGHTMGENGVSDSETGAFFHKEFLKGGLEGLSPVVVGGAVEYVNVRLDMPGSAAATVRRMTVMVAE